MLHSRFNLPDQGKRDDARGEKAFVCSCFQVYLSAADRLPPEWRWKIASIGPWDSLTLWRFRNHETKGPEGEPGAAMIAEISAAWIDGALEQLVGTRSFAEEQEQNLSGWR